MTKKNRAGQTAQAEPVVTVVTVEEFLESIVALPPEEQVTKLTERLQADNVELVALRSEKATLELELEQAEADDVIEINGVKYTETEDAQGRKVQIPR
ncbi:MAG: hypothetical protein ACRDAM_21340 [Casimicrobium sp.]